MTRPIEAQLLAELDAHDALVARCARGELDWEEFARLYDSFYVRYPLDGHESDAEERQLFEKHASRIALHREVWEQVLTQAATHEQAAAEAVRRLQVLGRAHRKG